MIQAYFNQIRKKIIEEINNSNKDIIIAVAWFTQHDLFDAIINALERGVNISLILIKDIINCGDYGLDFSLYLQKVYLANLHTSFLCNLIYPTFSRILLYSY